MPGLVAAMADPEDHDISSLTSRLSRLLSSESMSDVTFVVDDPPTRFPCHKLILGLGSSVFRAMFYGQLAEGEEVRVTDATADGFSVMLRYLYTDTIHLQSPSEAFEAAYVAQKYLVAPLFDACETYLLQHIPLDPESVFCTHEEAAFLNMGRLKGRCLRYVARNARRVLASRSFGMCSKTTLEDILGLDLMDIESEVEVMEALWRWGEEQCKLQNIENSPLNIRTATRDFLKHVRFLSLAKKTLEDALARFQLLDTEDELAMLWNLTMPKLDGTLAKTPFSLCGLSRTRSVTNCSKLELPTEYRYDGSLTVFSIAKHTTSFYVTVSGPQVTILGAVLTFKPIPCYSPDHRSLDFELSIGNVSTSHTSRARLLSRSKVENNDTPDRSKVDDENGFELSKPIVEIGHRLEKSISRVQNDVGVDESKTTVENRQQRLRSRVESDEEESDRLDREVLLDDFVVLSDGETAWLRVEVASEGVRLMQCVENEFTTRCGESLLTFSFDGTERALFPIKELLYVV